ncbi:MYCBP-associated protein family-domain-containing protein [Blyttiomyces helicus]|uniref:MYCBP-associated protein family-domain-containing protein n=1 Tax=Blyttiomyces helicus TaxID=388810 RepID=A0A4V1ISF3_9FUNG|nr:MYCBP-associated protein family-domain-containing protein [Blyttiomyces helicus]|eukprot:RKO93357.1 MYCBP-associated protein family-domain-containing protein [Blyttiomyces helicus]
MAHQAVPIIAAVQPPLEEILSLPRLPSKKGSILDEMHPAPPPDPQALTTAHRSAKKRLQILVAKRIPPDYMGQDSPVEASERKQIPITLWNTASDFAEMEKLHGGAPAAELARDSDGSKNSEGELETSAQLLGEHRAREKESRRKHQEDRLRWLNQLHIFQRYIEVREEHALKNWKRHSVQWNRMEEDLARRSHKNPTELLMARLGEWRERVEEHNIVEEALKLLEHEHVDFWRTGLKLGSDLLGLTMPMPKGGPRQIERCRTYEPKSQYRGKDVPYRAAKKGELKDLISVIDPFADHGGGGHLEVVGRSTLDYLASALISRMDALASASDDASGQAEADDSDLAARSPISRSPSTSPSASHFPHRASTTASNRSQDRLEEDAAAEGEAGDEYSDGPLAQTPGPSLVFAMNRMSFVVEIGEVPSSILTVYNRGTTSCYFEWVLEERPNPLGRFFFYYTKGVILPNTAFDFPIMFKSASPVVFAETWRLATSPVGSEGPEKRVALQGIAIEPDTNKKKREKVQNLISRRRATTAATETVESMLRNMKPRSGSDLVLDERAIDDDEREFMKRNRDLHTLGLAAGGWDRSITTLYELINLSNDLDWRSEHLEKLNDLVALASTPPEDKVSPVLYMIGYDILVGLADSVSEASETIRKSLELPLERAATRFFEPDDVKEDTDCGLEGLKGRIFSKWFNGTLEVDSGFFAHHLPRLTIISATNNSFRWGRKTRWRGGRCGAQANTANRWSCHTGWR